MRRGIRVFSLMGAIAMVMGTVGATPSAMAGSHAVPEVSETAFSGFAYGTEVRNATTVTSHSSALSKLDCTAQDDSTETNSVPSVSVPDVLSTGEIDTSAASQTTSAGADSTSSVTSQDVSLLGGLVSATTVEAVSTTSQSATTQKFSTSAAGTQFAGLSVEGTAVSGTPAPNTRMTLPGVGYVILNQQSSFVYAHSANLSIMGIRVVVTKTSSVAKAGTQIFVSDANSVMGGPASGLLFGLAYGTGSNIDFYKVAHYTYTEPLGCTGTDGLTRTNTGPSTKIGQALTTGTVTDTVSGTDTATAVSGTVSSTVQDINVGDGLVTATSIDTVVTANGNPPTLANDSTFEGLTVEGKPITGTPLPNTKMSLPGVGTLWLNWQSKNAWRIALDGILIDVTVANNPLKLKPGTIIEASWVAISVN
jgi:hypothetical protein